MRKRTRRTAKCERGVRDHVKFADELNGERTADLLAEEGEISSEGKRKERKTDVVNSDSILRVRL
jgi:hypothetical protein